MKIIKNRITDILLDYQYLLLDTNRLPKIKLNT